MTLADAALLYALRSIAVFPLIPRQKRPAGAHGLKEATTDADQVLAWWRRTPGFNIGIATGGLAGFWVLDIDGEDGARSLAALEAEHGALPPTVEQSTGKGRHICFAWDRDGPEVRNSASRIGPGVDVRGEGGYIVASPSIHPSGRLYAWAEGRAPGEIDLAPAPEWLVRLAAPPPAKAEPPAPRAPRRIEAGRASAYGEAALTNACREISGARPGTQNATLFWRAYSIGRLVEGGEIELAYARSALEGAGGQMIPAGKPWTRAEIEDTVERGLERGAGNPRTAPERREPRAAGAAAAAPAAASTPAEAAQAKHDAAGLWAQARPADCALVRAWLDRRGLSRANFDPLPSLRMHPDAPIGRDARGPALLAALWRERPGEIPDALAVLPLTPGEDGREAERFAWFVGDRAGKAVWLNAEPHDQLLVAIDLQDAWVLADGAFESGDPMAVAVAPTLSAFAGGAMGDRFGRIDPEAPAPDPERRPWTVGGFGRVWAAVRQDLKPPELRARKALGGTRTVRLEGPAAARFWGGLAVAAWRAARPELGANAVRLISPPSGRAGFNDHSGGCV